MGQPSAGTEETGAERLVPPLGIPPAAGPSQAGRVSSEGRGRSWAVALCVQRAAAECLNSEGAFLRGAQRRACGWIVNRA